MALYLDTFTGYYTNRQPPTTTYAVSGVITREHKDSLTDELVYDDVCVFYHSKIDTVL